MVINVRDSPVQYSGGISDLIMNFTVVLRPLEFKLKFFELLSCKAVYNLQIHRQDNFLAPLQSLEDK